MKRACVLWVLGMACACASRPAPPLAPTAAQRWLDIRVAVARDAAGRITTLTERVCNPLRHAIHLAPDEHSARAVGEAIDARGFPLAHDAMGDVLEAQHCGAWSQDVAKLADVPALHDRVLLAGDDVFVTSDVWLPRSRDVELPARIVSVHGAKLFAPFSRNRAGDYVIDADEGLVAGCALGDFTTTPIDVLSTHLEVIALGTRPLPATFVPWLTDAASAVAALAPQAFAPQIQVVVVEAPSAAPILDGTFYRGGGALALFRVANTAAALDADHLNSGRFALVHELAHAWLPPTSVEDAWFNEGLATLHQDLLARRHRLIDTDDEYWLALVRGFATGQAAAQQHGMSLAEASARMHSGGHHTQVYFGGAAVAFLAEVQAQQQGASLDDVVVALAPHRHNARERASAWLARAGAKGGRAAIAAGVWLATWSRVSEVGFPDVAPTLQALGVNFDGRTVVLDDDAPLAHIRQRITARFDTATTGKRH